MNVKDALTKRALPNRVEDVVACVIHTTGDSDLSKILAWYESPKGLQPHYVIGYDGTVYHTAHESQIAYHCKIDPHEAALYRQGFHTWSQWIWKDERPVNTGQEATNYRSWRETWRDRGMQSPLNLITGEHPNGRSVGVELQQPVKPGGRIFTDAQYLSLAGLLDDIAERHTVTLDREHLLGHYDCSPMRRSNERGSWDPGYAFSWNYLFDLLGG